jgi:hypothetical protein
MYICIDVHVYICSDIGLGLLKHGEAIFFEDVNTSVVTIM